MQPFFLQKPPKNIIKTRKKMRYANSYSHIGIFCNHDKQRVSVKGYDFFGCNCLSIRKFPSNEIQLHGKQAVTRFHLISNDIIKGIFT